MVEFINTSIASSSDDIELSILISVPSEKPKAILQIVHGMCEYKERYKGFMEYISLHGYVCVIHDHRGHGKSVKSSDDLGYFYKGGYSAMIEDTKYVRDFARAKYPGLYPILFGHSMGSMIARAYLKRYDRTILGLVVCGSPSRNRAAGIAQVLAWFSAKIFGDRYRPRFIQKLAFGPFNSRFRHEGSPNAWICSDPEVVQAYDRDPLCSFTFTANGFYNLFSLMRYTYRKFGWKVRNPMLPILFISGKEDPCMRGIKNFKASVKTLSDVGYEDVVSMLLPGMRHEILNEKGKENVWYDILYRIDIWTSSLL